jgi:TatD DNase family protein
LTAGRNNYNVTGTNKKERNIVYSDSHCHLFTYQSPKIAGVLRQAKEQGVVMALSMGENLESSADTVRLAQSHDIVLAGVGIHPWNATPPTDEVCRKLSELTSRKEVVAIGEIGLDYARNPDNKETQRELLNYQLSLAREKGLPVSVHSREAHQDMMSILGSEARGLSGVAHGFTGDRAMLEDWLELGFYISIGVRGFISSEIPHLSGVIRQIPPERLLVETDAAVVEGVEGPAAVTAVVQKIASLIGVSPQETAAATTANLKRFLQKE